MPSAKSVFTHRAPAARRGRTDRQQKARIREKKTQPSHRRLRLPRPLNPAPVHPLRVAADGGRETHLGGERAGRAQGPLPLAGDSSLRVRLAPAAAIAIWAARSHGCGEAGARAPGSCGPRAWLHSWRPGAHPSLRSQLRASLTPSAARATSCAPFGPLPCFALDLSLQLSLQSLLLF